MTRAGWMLAGVAALALAGSGAVVAGGWQDAPPQDARPADPIGDALKAEPTQEAAPSAAPAPADPVAITPPAPAVETVALEEEKAEEKAADEDLEDQKAKDGESEEDKAERLAAQPPVPRQRRPIAVVEAIDKITAESMRFEVEVGGRPVRFANNLIFTAKACEVSGETETVKDAIAYLEVTLQPRAVPGATPRQIFRGWMYASSPAVSGLQHPIYDAWVVGCKA